MSWETNFWKRARHEALLMAADAKFNGCKEECNEWKEYAHYCALKQAEAEAKEATPDCQGRH